MSGQDGSRGYLIQALIALLQSLDDPNWESVSVEPNQQSEKIDIQWDGDDYERYVQVKSSKNKITLPMVKAWVGEINEDFSTAKCELVLIGSPTQSVIRLEEYDGVLIPTPKTLDIEGLKSQAAHKLDVFLVNANLGHRLPDERELLVAALTSRLLELGTSGLSLAREGFVEQLSLWINSFRDIGLHQNELLARERFFYQRIPRNPHFSGREEILCDLGSELRWEGLKQQRKVAAIVGLGGQGKTQIASEFAYRNESKYEAVLWVNAESFANANSDLGKWARTRKLCSDEDTIEDAALQAKLWLLSNTNWLLILDNVDSEAIANQFVPSTGDGHVIITSRLRDFQELGGSQFEVKEFSEVESIAFLTSRTRRAESEQAELDALTALAKELGGLPLALEQASAYIVSKQSSFTSYLSSFREQRLEVLEKASPLTGKYDSTVATTWHLNIAAVRRDSPISVRAFRYCSLLASTEIPSEFFVHGASDMGRNMADHMAGFFPTGDETLVDDILAPLAKFSLITRNSMERTFSIHKLVQEVTRFSLSKKVAAHYRKKLLRAMATCFPIVKVETMPFCQRLIQHGIHAFHLADEIELQNLHCATLAHRMGHYIEELGDYKLAISVYQYSAKTRLKICGEKDAEYALTMNNIAVVLQKMGRYKDAENMFRDALEIRTSLLREDHPDLAQAMYNLGLTVEALGKHKEAEDLSREASKIFEKTEDTFYQSNYASCLTSLARQARRDGNIDEAKERLKQARAIHEKGPFKDFDPRYALLLREQAVITSELGDVESAFALLDQAEQVLIRSRGQDHFDYAIFLEAKGHLLLQSGNCDAALPVFSLCSATFEATAGGTHPRFAHSLTNKANCLRECKSGSFSEIEALLQRAIDIYSSSLGEHNLETATARNNLAYAYLIEGEFQKSVEIYKEVALVREAILGKLHNDVAICFGNIGLCHAAMGQAELADTMLFNAYQIYLNLGFPNTDDCVGCLFHFANFRESQGKIKSAAAIRKKRNKIRRKPKY